MNGENLEAFLHAQIPLTRAMGVTVESWDQDALVLTAPLAPNHNHLGTAFGGSLSALATLTGYALLWMKLGNSEAHVVVSESSIRYLRPVRGTLRAICRSPAEAEWAVFVTDYHAKGKARIHLRVQVLHGQQVCVEFAGVFVAVRAA